jgi:hypothetical protein
MESLAGTTFLHALAEGFGLETDSQPQRQIIKPDGEHQARWQPDDS